MAKVLIIGAKGNLGTQLMEEFRIDNEVIGWDKEEIDITDEGLIAKKVADLKPNIIINAAAYNAVDKCEEDEKEFEIAKKINGAAVGYLAKAALKARAVVIHYSSDYVFSGKERKGYKETDAPEPINNYGRSKLMGEQELIKLSGKGLKWYLIRVSKLFGPKGISAGAKPSFFDIMLKLSREKKVIDVVNEETSCFTYTADLAKATRRLLDEDMGYGIYHLPNSFGCTWFKAAKDLFKLSGITDVKINPVTSEHFPRPAKRPKYAVLLNTKTEPLRDWREALRDYLKNKEYNP